VNPLKKLTNTRLIRSLWLLTETTVAERVVVHRLIKPGG
jgi:hypothetical protein